MSEAEQPEQESVLQRADRVVIRDDMPDRDPSENEGLDLTAPVDNIPSVPNQDVPDLDIQPEADWLETESDDS